MKLIDLPECATPPAWALLEAAGFEVCGAEWERADRRERPDDYGDCVLVVGRPGEPQHAVLSSFPYESFRVLGRGELPVWADLTRSLLSMGLS